jgi:2-polyprenyl-3-methyl-5-hydroxy-6-metoxy-1,4-benzoquinol methylase
MNTENLDDIIASHDLPNCPVCGSLGHPLFSNLTDKLFGSLGTWNTKKCSNPSCALLWLDPMPNEDEIGKAYKNYYTHESSSSNIIPSLLPLEKPYLSLRYGYDFGYNCLRKASGLLMYLFPTEKAEIDYNVLYFNNKERGKLLDIGCGNGTFINRMHELGWETQGIDPDPKAVDYCRQKGLSASQGDILSQNFSAETFDIITLNHVIEHVSNPQALVQECFRILKKQGILIMATPNANSWMFRRLFRSNWFSLDPPRHLFIYNKNNLSTIFQDAGLNIVSAKTTIRNEFWVHLGSSSIKKYGYFKMGASKQPKSALLKGKLFQLLTWLILFFNKQAGGELVIKAQKP